MRTPYFDFAIGSTSKTEDAKEQVVTCEDPQKFAAIKSECLKQFDIISGWRAAECGGIARSVPKTHSHHSKPPHSVRFELREFEL